MVRKIVHIDEEKCNGCGLCAGACHEGAIEMVDGKAKLVREDFCDGFGDCLPNCPTGAIAFEEREAPEYDAAAVKAARNATGTRPQAGAHNATERSEALSEEGDRKMELSEQAKKMMEQHGLHPGGSCPGSAMRQMSAASAAPAPAPAAGKPVSRLGQWPCQIKLVPAKAPFFDGAKLLIAADCTAYAYADLHEGFMRGKVTLIGCPKLDGVDYTEKLTAIIANNNIQSVTIVRMEVPCCGGLQRAAENALKASGKFIPWQVVTVSVDGNILE